ncbi:hypothetical protein C8R43DRAFT_160188 [Mycena crocata]|nr:hypothetical protein C8R43DRAFT_160188 [Mycena crocata]
MHDNKRFGVVLPAGVDAQNFPASAFARPLHAINNMEAKFGATAAPPGIAHAKSASAAPVMTRTSKPSASVKPSPVQEPQPKPLNMLALDGSSKKHNRLAEGGMQSSAGTRSLHGKRSQSVNSRLPQPSSRVEMDTSLLNGMAKTAMGSTPSPVKRAPAIPKPVAAPTDGTAMRTALRERSTHPLSASKSIQRNRCQSVNSRLPRAAPRVEMDTYPLDGLVSTTTSSPTTAPTTPASPTAIAAPTGMMRATSKGPRLRPITRSRAGQIPSPQDTGSQQVEGPRPQSRGRTRGKEEGRDQRETGGIRIK